jgi:ATP/maltotriose-dependent transcriptional regulator MalT
MIVLGHSVRAAAFGDAPSRWPLPAAESAEERWLRAVAAGGQGRYATADADLAWVHRAHRRGRLASLAYSTHASFLRQLGWHATARGFDGRALAVADGDAEALGDALIGLAADALGVGRFAASAAALERVERLLEDAPPRTRVRQAWVSAELAMATGDGTAATRHAERACALAAATGSTRHRLKSDVVLAAALCSAGQTDWSREVADAALGLTQDHGLVPLSWALTCLLDGIGSGNHSAAAVVGIRDQSADAVRRRGGVFFPR